MSSSVDHGVVLKNLLESLTIAVFFVGGDNRRVEVAFDDWGLMPRLLLLVDLEVLSDQSIIIHVEAGELPDLFIEDSPLSENVNDFIKEGLVLKQV
jgi:hypothetical protein